MRVHVGHWASEWKTFKILSVLWVLLAILDGGADRNRTCDLLIANETLYQLSYDPIQRIVRHWRDVEIAY